ncbi:MAG: CCA tRNA nucleotidyltransferase [Clostridia bacterium]|nr:CCA tRNA nucleotidyltransferase [Clostridia bacterium]
MIISPAGLEIIEKLEKSGFEAYFVGGCVRDVLMGKHPGDIDITTSASPEEVIHIFEKTYPTGINHGTVTVAENGILAEVTTYRCEKGYKDFRHPDGVEFVSDIGEDLCRRDFTVNAIAYNPSKGIVDNFGGQKDVESKVIRCVGEPDSRFAEDALRMVRAVRFAAVLGFEIEQKTLDAIKKNAHLASSISKERIAVEFEKTVLGDFPENAKLWQETGLIKYLAENSKAIDFLTFKKLANLPKIAPLRFAVIMNGGGAAEFLKELRFSNEIIKTTESLIVGIGIETPIEIKRYINKNGIKNAELLVYINSIKYKTELEKIFSEKHPIFIRDLKINGTDIMEMGITGKKTGQILLHLLEKVWENPGMNTKEKLIKLIEEDFAE